MTEKEFRTLKGWDVIIDVLGDYWFIDDAMGDYVTIQAVNSPYKRKAVDVKDCIEYYLND